MQLQQCTHANHLCACACPCACVLQVIPVTQENGLIEWVANTVPIKAVLEDEWTAMLQPTAHAMRIDLAPSGNIKALAYVWSASPSAGL